MNDLKKAILSADDRPYEDIEVKEWDSVIRIRGVDGMGAETFARLVDAGSDDTNTMAALLVRTITDPETGKLVFAHKDAPKLATRAGSVLTRLFTIAVRLSGLDDVDEVKND